MVKGDDWPRQILEQVEEAEACTEEGETALRL